MVKQNQQLITIVKNQNAYFVKDFLSGANYRIKLITFLRNHSKLFMYYAVNRNKRNEQKLKTLRRDDRFQEMRSFYDWFLNGVVLSEFIEDLHFAYERLASNVRTSKFDFFFNQLRLFRMMLS